MIKLIAIVLDGTLLDDRKIVSVNNQKAISECIKQNVKIAIVTGRPLIGIEKVLKKYSFYKELIVASNSGSYIEDLYTNSSISKSTLEIDDYIKIRSLIKEKEITITAYTEDSIFTIDEKPNNEAILDSKILKLNIKPFERLKQSVNQEISRINIMGSKEYLDKVLPYLLSKFNNKYKVIRNEYFSIEILNREVGKDKAIEKIIEYLNIAKKEVMTIGDGMNDIEMIKEYGIGVAMENSSDYVKSKCDFITLSNNNDGVSYAIKKLLN
ncbi:MAG: Cof-type HAD-IIB family hydrolase [Tissierellia bacterium]|nr:Cof-type HAD-IIB family hydrolase [Tissierellia bacterium]